MRIIKLIRLGKGFLVTLLIAAMLTVFHQFSYSYVPLFTQYLIEYLEHAPASYTSLVNFPAFVIRFLQSADTIIGVVVYVALALLGLQFFRFTLRFFEGYTKGILSENIQKKLRLRMFGHIQNLSFDFHNQSDSGDLIQRVTSDIDTVTQFLSQNILEIIYLIATISFGAFQLFQVNSTIVYATLGLMPLMAVSSVIYFKKIDKLMLEVEQDESALMTVIQENLSSVKVVRAFANEAFEIKKLEHRNSAFKEKNRKVAKIDAAYWGIMDFIAVMQYLVVILIAVYFRFESSQMVVSLSLVGMLIWPIRGLGRIINSFGKALVASDRINEILDLKEEYLVDGKETPDIQGHIIFDQLSFKYDNSTNYVLKDVSFEIKANQTTAIIGKTGSGKSTLIHLLLRMYDYKEGEIILDGYPLKNIEKKHVRRNIGAVLQDPFLYAKTVYENIAITNQKIAKDLVEDAARKAALEKDIQTFKQGYETIVGEKGTTLSGGQKQRVAIARVLVDHKPILIFDDALSAVDTETDQMIRDALKQSEEKATSIIITHRITTAKEADMIVVFNEGTVEAVGTHETLIKTSPLYKKLWAIQGEIEEAFEADIQGGDLDV